MIKAGHGGQHDGSCFRDALHIVEGDQTEWRFAGNDDQFAAFLQMDICRSMDQVLRLTGRDGGERSHGTGADHHSLGEKGTTGDAGRVVSIVMIDQSPREDLAVTEHRTGGRSRQATGSQDLQFFIVVDLVNSGQQLLGIKIVEIKDQPQFAPHDFDGSRADSQMHRSARGHQNFD